MLQWIQAFWEKGGKGNMGWRRRLDDDFCISDSSWEGVSGQFLESYVSFLCPHIYLPLQIFFFFIIGPPSLLMPCSATSILIAPFIVLVTGFDNTGIICHFNKFILVQQSSNSYKFIIPEDSNKLNFKIFLK